MIKTFQKYCIAVVCILSLTSVSGCVPLIAGAAAGAGGIAYVKGALVENVNDTVEDIHKACLAALKDLGLFVTDDELNQHSASIQAEYKDGGRIRIHIDALTEYVSKITIRVGTFGDEDESRWILEAIRKKL